jgi:uncharacterized protein with HEPN domain
LELFGSAARSHFNPATSDLDFLATFDDSDGTVERRFEIAAEALNQLSKTHPSLASRIPDLPSLIGFRNVLAHEYAAVSNRIVWDQVRGRAPAPLDQIETLLRETGRGADPNDGGSSQA